MLYDYCPMAAIARSMLCAGHLARSKGATEQRQFGEIRLAIEYLLCLSNVPDFSTANPPSLRIKLPTLKTEPTIQRVHLHCKDIDP